MIVSGHEAPCPYCGLSFNTFSQQAQHLSRHCQLNWDTFRIPQFFPTGCQPRIRSGDDEAESLGETHKEKQALKESLNNRVVGQFRKRPTARKSCGVWR